MTQERASLCPQVFRLSEHSLPWGIGARGAACALLAILLVFGIAARDRIAPGQYRVAGLDDTACHLAIIERIAAGEPVYTSIGTELRARGYPSGSTANWRTPLHYWTVAQVGTARIGTALVILANLTVVLGAYALRHRFRGAWFVAGALLMGTMVPIIAFRPAGVVMAEYWAGMLVALALAFYHLRWWTAAACCGVVAIFVRELAVPFGVVCGLFALSERRHREGAVWVVGGLAYVAVPTCSTHRPSRQRCSRRTGPGRTRGRGFWVGPSCCKPRGLRAGHYSCHTRSRQLWRCSRWSVLSRGRCRDNSGGRSLRTPCCSAVSASRSISTGGSSPHRSGHMRCCTALRVRSSSSSTRHSGVWIRVNQNGRLQPWDRKRCQRLLCPGPEEVLWHVRAAVLHREKGQTLSTAGCGSSDTGRCARGVAQHRESRPNGPCQPSTAMRTVNCSHRSTKSEPDA